ncbi:hypothetical protein PROFUN_01255 [Planoprotostelium fungivorum]|uniref:GPI-anchored wall transfer protein 1 n=1 Tax=Planoprotostelium fungivorum TaxID=1890364 RepID=A0A2P6NZM0_9EUKA|nr:hypothetical protein PROFUN_01255 [Planoprotostelium fungivorum]
MTYKEQHETFLSNNDGTTFTEVTLLLTLSPSSLVGSISQEPSPTDAFDSQNALITKDPRQTTDLSGNRKSLSLPSFSFSRLPGFITEHRSLMMLSTFLAILAVDFPVFPRRLSKTETFGVSLMDAGVGSFLLAASLTSKQVRREGRSRGYIIWKTFLSSSPLLVIGLIRLIGVKSADYQEHVSEYGVHWNFFFTLAFVSILLSVLSVPTRHNIIVAIIIMITYQAALSLGLSEYLMNNDRSNLLSMNKEGVFSLCGYVSLFLVGSQFGDAMFRARWGDDNKGIVLKLMSIDAVLWMLTFIAETFVEKCSRRSANLAYVLSTLAMNLWIVTGLILVSLFTLPQKNEIIEAINYNGLAMFMLANLSTGVVNLSIKTIYYDDLSASVILLGYLLFVSLVSILLYRKRIQLKFW